MQDLLNEEDFTAEKPYNPWKRFAVFYAVAVVHTGLFFYLALYVGMSPTTRFIGIPLFFLILAMPFIMIFGKKANYALPRQTITTAVCGLMMVYSIPYLVADVLYNGIYFLFSKDNFIAMSIILGYGVLASIIIIPVAGRLEMKAVERKSRRE